MTGIAQKILANPSAYSIEMLTRGVQDGVIPAYIGIPLIQQKTQEQAQAAGMQGAQQGKQPPIAEEVLAQAQQASGVDQLSSNLPTQSYAPGGIVAFAGGGDTDGRVARDGYVYESPYDKMNRLNREAEAKAEAARAAMTPADREAQARRDRAAMMGLPAAAADFVGGPYNYLAQTGESVANAVGIPRLGRALGIYGSDVNSVNIPRIGRGGDTPYSDMLNQYAAGNPTASKTPTPPTPVGTSRPGQMTTANDPRVAQASTAPGINQLVKPPAAPPPATGMNAPTDTGAGATGAASPFAFEPRPAGGSLFDMTKGEIGGYASRAAARDKDLLDNLNVGKPVGKPLEDYKKSLQEEAQQAGADREQARGMAIFKAGLAMMSGTSQFALENIGKGAMVGAEDWQAANKDLKRAQKERQKELAAIEQAERAENRDDFKSAQKYRAEAADRADTRDRFGVSAYMNAGVKDKEIATTQWGHVLDAQMKKYATDEGAKTSRDVANIGAGATRYAANVGASSRVQAAELKAAVAGAAGEKGGLTQDQLLKWRGEYASHPEVLAFKKQLIDQYGKNVVDKPEFQQALTQKIDQVLARDATRNIGGGAAPAGYKFLGKE